MAEGFGRSAKPPAHSAERGRPRGDTDDGASPSPAAPPDHAGISADRPRTRLEEDELGHRPFAETIAAGLASRAGADGMVIAVHGRWGSGKTSAVNMAVDALSRLEANLDEDRRTIVAHFNPWWFSEQRDLTRAFFSELNASIGRKLSTGVRDGLRRMAKRTSGATELMSAALQWTPVAPFSKPIADAIRATSEGADEERSLEAIRDDLARALERERRNIVVVVDDVDRLLAEEARQIFRLVKSVADLPRVTYLLVFDRDVAARALAQPADADGPEWLEKIVQASFDLPPVAQVDLNRLFVARLGAIVGNEPVEDVVRWGNLLHGAIAPWLRTPRDVTRLANAIALAWPSVRGEVDVGDFAAIQTLRLFEPALHAFIRSHPDDLTGREPMHGAGNGREDFGRSLLATVPEGRRDRARTALTYLFPRLDAVLGNHWHGDDWREAERKRLVSAKRRFPVYFHLGLNDGIVSAAEMREVREVLADPEATCALVRRYADQSRRSGGTRAAVLLNALMAMAEAVPDAEAEATARSLMAAADLFLGSADGESTPDGLPTRWAISFAVRPMLEKLPAGCRLAVLADALEGPSPLFATFMSGIMSSQHGRLWKDEAKPESERLLPLDAVIELEERMLTRIVRDAESGAITSTDQAASELYVWARMAGDQAVRDWVSARFEQPGFAAWLMRTFTGQGTSQTWGDMVGKRFHTVQRDSVAALLDVDRLEAVARGMVAASADPDGAAANFLEGLEERF